jgi:hypothetical protein
LHHNGCSDQSQLSRWEPATRVVAGVAHTDIQIVQYRDSRVIAAGSPLCCRIFEIQCLGGASRKPP